MKAIIEKKEFKQFLKDMGYNTLPFNKVIPKDTKRFNIICDNEDIGITLARKGFLDSIKNKAKEEIEGFGGLIVYNIKGWNRTNVIEIYDPTPGLSFSIYIICYNV